MSTQRTVKLSELSALLGEAVEKNIAATKAGVASGCYRSLPDLVQHSPVDTGQYAQSWDVVVTDLEVTIGNFAPHAGVIEFGARPFTPPIKPLLEWAKRVLGDASQPPDYSPEVWGLARGVQKKISEEGMKPKAIMSEALKTYLKENIWKEIQANGG